MGSDLTAREYQSEDAEMVREWWWTHNGGALPVAMLPPVGVIVQRAGMAIAACWLYMAVGVGVCWAEYPVTRPGISLTEARRAMSFALNTLVEIARVHDYGVMRVHTLPAIARFLEREHGFQRDGERIQLIKVINENGN